MPTAIQSRINGSPDSIISVRELVVMLGAMGDSGMIVTGTENSAVPARFRTKQLYQPAEEAVVLQTVSVLVVGLMMMQS